MMGVFTPMQGKPCPEEYILRIAQSLYSVRSKYIDRGLAQRELIVFSVGSNVDAIYSILTNSVLYRVGETLLSASVMITAKNDAVQINSSDIFIFRK